MNIFTSHVKLDSVIVPILEMRKLSRREVIYPHTHRASCGAGIRSRSDSKFQVHVHSAVLTSGYDLLHSQGELILPLPSFLALHSFPLGPSMWSGPIPCISYLGRNQSFQPFPFPVSDVALSAFSRSLDRAMAVQSSPYPRSPRLKPLEWDGGWRAEGAESIHSTVTPCSV